MEFSWFFVLASLCLCVSLKTLLNLIQHIGTKRTKLPPGPYTVPILGNFQWLRKSSSDLESILRNLRSKYGPIISLKIGHQQAIFIANHDLAHQALVQNGANFSDRLPVTETSRIVTCNQHNISSASYGPLWRLLRRNISSEIFHTSRIKSYAPGRKWVLQILKKNLKSESESESGQPVCVVDHFQYAMFCLLVLMCFGEKFDEKVIREIETVLRDSLVEGSKFNVLNFFPKLGKIVFRKLWCEFFDVRRNHENVLIPLIRSRQEKMKDSSFVAYVDTLLNLSLPDEGGRKLNDSELVSLCSEFLNAGTDTTSATLQWIMANLVKNQEIQEKVFDEVRRVVRSVDDEIEEDDLRKMPYLKAVVLEGLRRHPPVHFLLSHTVAKDTTLDGYDVPKGVAVNVMVAEMGWDPKVWEEPMEFKPDRFLNSSGEVEVFDITGSRGIKMMPFGAGRRICPGLGLAMLHLEYFVANLVKEFEWTAKIGDEVDLSEKQEFAIVMKNPLRAHITPRIIK